MLQFFMNPLMLIGLAGIALPVVAHLLSRRKFDVVNWAAMQFLNPSRKTRQKMRLEELLLLLIRIGIIALIGFALARPWINSGFLMGYHSAGSRDVVLIIDGSNSMARSDGLTSLHQKAVRRAKEFLTTLGPGDTVSVIDARDLPIKMFDSSIQNFELVREKLDTIPPATGAADLRKACEEAVGVLGRCSNGAREIVVLTDRQRASWGLAGDSSWQRFDEILKFPAVRPSVWIVDLSQGLSAIRQNVSVGQVEVSRDLTPVNYPVAFQVQIRNSGTSLVNAPVQVLVNGQRVAGMDATVSVPAGSHAIFSRSMRFNTEGTNLISVKVDLPSDAVAADNESHAAVRVTPTVPVLLVESSNSLSKRRWNTFFAQMALSPSQETSPWIEARTIKANDLTAEDLASVSAVVLADVFQLPKGMAVALQQFAAGGKGVFITLGDATSVQSFDALYGDTGLVSGVKLKRIRTAAPAADVPITIAPYSLEADWLTRFRERKGASLLRTSFREWWLIEIQRPVAAVDQPAMVSGSAILPESETDTRLVQPIHANAVPATIAQLITGDPLLLQSFCGRGSVLLMTSNIDAEWNSLPTQPDFVPFLHEALFQMASSSVSRNVSFGAPLFTELQGSVSGIVVDDGNEGDFIFRGPFDRSEKAIVSQSAELLTARLPGTRLPGVYELAESSEENAAVLDAWVVNYDHSEDEPQELTNDDKAYLAMNKRMLFLDSMETLQKNMYGNESRSELWGLLMWLFLGMLTLEVWIIRRLVTKGHANIDTPQSPIPA